MSGKTAAKIATMTPVIAVMSRRRAENVMDARDAGRQHAVARHHVEDPHLSEQRRQHHGRVSRDAADGNDPVERVILGDRAERIEHRRAVGKPVVAHHADRAKRQRDVEDSAEHEREDDADRHVALGPLRFFRRDRHRVESDVRKEHQRGARENAVIAERRERVQVRRDDRVRDDRDENDHRDDLHHDERTVDARRLANADGDQGA